MALLVIDHRLSDNVRRLDYRWFGTRIQLALITDLGAISNCFDAILDDTHIRREYDRTWTNDLGV